MADGSTESDEPDEPPVDASSLSSDETSLLLSFLPVSALKEAGCVSSAWRAAAVESWQTHLRERFGVRATGPAAIRSYATHSAQALGKSWLTAVRVADQNWHLNMRTNVSACVDAASGTAMLVTPYNAAVVPLPRASFERVTHAVSTVHELPAPESVECMAARACGAAWTTSRGEVSVLCGWPGGETTRRWSAELLAPEESRAALAPLAVDLAPGDGVVPVVGLNVADSFRLYRCEGDAERPDPALSLQLRCSTGTSTSSANFAGTVITADASAVNVTESYFLGSKVTAVKSALWQSMTDPLVSHALAPRADNTSRRSKARSGWRRRRI